MPLKEEKEDVQKFLYPSPMKELDSINDKAVHKRRITPTARLSLMKNHKGLIAFLKIAFIDNFLNYCLMVFPGYCIENNNPE